MQTYLDKLSNRLLNACERCEENGSENHWTATTWLLFFEDLNCRVIFDSEGTGDHDRPDIQVWLSKNDNTTPDLWVESKFPYDFNSKSKKEKAHKEVLEKLKACLRHNQALPKFVLVTDFDTSFAWSIESFKRILETGETSDIFTNLGKPFKTLNASKPSQFKAGLKDLVGTWKKSAETTEETSQPLDLDKLISELLLISSDFRDNHLATAVEILHENKKTKKLYDEWLECGGELTVETVNSEAKKSNVGGEEAFAELCFHSVMVRFFVLKWFLDHGHLAPSETATLWGVISKDSPVSKWRALLAPKGKTDAERVLQNLLTSSEVYLWVLEAAGPSLWARIKVAFQRYTLVAERSDVLGEFYQRYMQKYAKKSQMLLGQFYTPHRLTRAMWKIAGEIMREKGISLADKSCLVIDPCVGTGTFLNQGLRLLLDGGWGDTKKTYKGDSLNAIFARFTGFEVNPLSRGVALVNSLTEVLAHSSDGCKTFDPKPRIFETNAYDIPDPKQQELFLSRSTPDEDESFRAWRNDILEASKAKARNQYRIVIGNPPWRNPSPACKNERIQGLLQNEIMPWAWEYQNQKLSSIKGCNHGIRDDYVFFFGLGMRLLQERGLLVYVTNESWLNAPTYTMFRRYLLDNFKVHTVIRVGPYFDGVKERAAVVAFEKQDKANSESGRQQKIRYLDWSDLSNTEWSKKWVEIKLQELIDGRIKRTEFQTVTPKGTACTIRPSSESRFDNEMHGCVPIEQLFSEVDAGAQSGCGPVFLSKNRNLLEQRVKLLFQGKTNELAEQIAGEVRGGREKAGELVNRIYDAIRQNKAKFDRDCIRPIWAHFKSGRGAADKKGYCYFDARLWLFPRVTRTEPGVKTMWDTKPKLVFRDIYDPDDKFIMAGIDTTGVVIDNHFFNGGVYVAAVKNADGSSRLSTMGQELREKFDSDAQFLGYLAAILNSTQIRSWSKSCPQERVNIPFDVDSRLAQKCADAEVKLEQIWARTTIDKNLDQAVEKLIEDLERRQSEIAAKSKPTSEIKDRVLSKAKKALEKAEKKGTRKRG